MPIWPPSSSPSPSWCCSPARSNDSCCARSSIRNRSSCSWRRSASPFFLDGFGQLVWGSDVHPLRTSASRRIRYSWASTGQRVRPDRGGVAGSLVAALALFFQFTGIGRALRAVADDHQAAHVGRHSAQSIWVIVWSVAGIVGARRRHHVGQQSRRAVLAVAGGAEGAAGADPRRLHLDPRRHRRRPDRRGRREARRSLSGVRCSAAASRTGSPMLALVFLLVRPQGLFGERIIERV